MKTFRTLPPSPWCLQIVLEKIMIEKSISDFLKFLLKWTDLGFSSSSWLNHRGLLSNLSHIEALTLNFWNYSSLMQYIPCSSLCSSSPALALSSRSTALPLTLMKRSGFSMISTDLSPYRDAVRVDKYPCIKPGLGSPVSDKRPPEQAKGS